ncbi:MAG: signal peptidase I [Chloroflexi bacterium]|nr:signal peptidase I [Chloroflexota bacterium]
MPLPAGLLIYRVQGASMTPMLQGGDYLLTRRLYANTSPPLRGEIVVVSAGTPERSQAKRIIGMPREHIALTDGTLLINGTRLAEAYLHGLTPYLGLDESSWQLGADEYFVMGDNRVHSSDSRAYGPVRAQQIEARAVCRVFPPSRWGRL